MLRTKSVACSCSRAEYAKDTASRRHSRALPAGGWSTTRKQAALFSATTRRLRTTCVAAAAAEAEDTHLEENQVPSFVVGDLSESESEGASASAAPETVKVTFQIPHSVPFGQEVVIAGDAQVLGSWSLSKAKKLAWNEGDLWTVTVDLPADSSIQYKYAITRHGNEDVEWMPGTNFSIQADPSAASQGRTQVAQDVWGRKSECKTVLLANGQQLPAATLAEVGQGEGLPGDISKMTVKDIKVMLKARGLPVSGKKADLIERLVNSDAL